MKSPTKLPLIVPGPITWRADGELRPVDCRHLVFRYSLKVFDLLRAARVSRVGFERWYELPSHDPRHPWPIAAPLSRGLASMLNDIAVTQIAESGVPLTPYQVGRLRAADKAMREIGS